MANKQMKSLLRLLVIREMQVKNNCTELLWKQINGVHIKCWQGCGENGSHLPGMLNGTATLENSVAVSSQYCSFEHLSQRSEI